MLKSPKIILRYVLGLVGVFGLGFVLLVTLHFSFLRLLANLDDELVNERARIAIGDVIISNISQLERNFYQLATSSTSSRGVEKIYASSAVHFERIEQAFDVFKNGGSLTVAIPLNEEGVDDFSRTITYQPEDTKHVLAIVDLRPKVLEIQERMQKLSYLVTKRNSLAKSGDVEALEEIREEIFLFLKKSPSHFVRLNENANGLYYQGHKNLEHLKEKIASRKSFYTRMTVGVMATIILGVFVICWLIARQIYTTHRELDFLSQEMEKAKGEAEVANKIKTDFMATMSHEVRTPMNIIIGMTGLALETKLTASQQRYLGKIQNAAEILLGLLDDILDFSKIEEGNLEFSNQPFDLGEIVYSVAEVIKMEARQKGIEVKAHVEDSSWTPGGDPVRMRQILLILASNAIKFTQRGEVEISAHLENLDSNQLLVVVSVRDTGIGIAEEQLATIFDTFAQADASATRRYGGTGLGLAISNQLAKLMGGEITVESTIGQGSTFTLTLPMRKVSSVVTSGDSSSCNLFSTGDADRVLDILMVDYDGHQQEVAKTFLEQAGHRVKKAEDGLEGLRCLAKFQYDMVFLALQMPVLDGATTASHIRAFERGDDVNQPDLGYDIDWLSARLNGHHTCVVAILDQAMPRDQALDETLFDDSIGKPYGRDDLVEVVTRFVGQTS